MNIGVFPFFRLALIWMSAIVLASLYPIQLNYVLVLVFVLFLIYTTLFLLIQIRPSYVVLPWCNAIGLLLLFFLSYSNFLLHTACNQRCGLPRWLSPWMGYRARLETVRDTSPHLFVCKASVDYVRTPSGWYRGNGVVYLYFSKKLDYKPENGQLLLICGAPRFATSFKDSSNKMHGVVYNHRHCQFLKRKQFMLCTAFQPLSCVLALYQWCSKIVRDRIKTTSGVALIETLLFGKKEQLALDLREAYAQTGTFHLLVVSGLHVNMLYGLIYAMTKVILGRIRYPILAEFFALFMLWLYGWLCAFTPPILRATIMLTVAKIALIVRRDTTPCNGLWIAAFITLLWDPLLLYNLGFQFSYIATLAILYGHGYIDRVRHFGWLGKIAYTTGLSFAAQMGTLPLMLYYFKQIPVYFVVANWIAVPAIYMVLLLSLLLLATAALPFINVWVAFALSKLIAITHVLITGIAKWPSATIAMAITGSTVCLLYVGLVAICLFFAYKRLIYPTVVSLCVAYYSVTKIAGIIAAQKQCAIICCYDRYFSFTLKDAVTVLHYNEQAHNCCSAYLHTYSGGVAASWHGRTIWVVDAIPRDWYRWKYPKLQADYLCLPRRLLGNIDILMQVFNCKTVVVYGNRSNKWINAIKPALSPEIVWVDLPSGRLATFVYPTYKSPNR